ncbi:hypothetical protein OHB13_37885 (plasmid) [Streptomyces sp. NBC_00440]|nr:hypothetical protein OG760_37240 [Streptomyces sp. NBC_00963]
MTRRIPAPEDFYNCLTARPDALLELASTLRCAPTYRCGRGSPPR